MGEDHKRGAAAAPRRCLGWGERLGMGARGESLLAGVPDLIVR